MHAPPTSHLRRRAHTHARAIEPRPPRRARRLRRGIPQLLSACIAAALVALGIQWWMDSPAAGSGDLASAVAVPEGWGQMDPVQLDAGDAPMVGWTSPDASTSVTATRAPSHPDGPRAAADAALPLLKDELGALDGVEVRELASGQVLLTAAIRDAGGLGLAQLWIPDGSEDDLVITAAAPDPQSAAAAAQEFQPRRG